MNPLIETLRKALEVGLSCAQETASEVHAKYEGYKPQRHAAVDADVKILEEAISLLSEVCSTDEHSMRQSFEYWCSNDGPWSANFNIERNAIGDYASSQTDGAWQVWLHLHRQNPQLLGHMHWHDIKDGLPPEGAEVITFNPKHQPVLQVNGYWRNYDAYDPETGRGATFWAYWPLPSSARSQTA